ncbi:MAG: glycine oxidase ThiO [Planctomycetia bacterium]|nr:glycine oxidase ThiO [Planctomycetia bacterium]
MPEHPDVLIIGGGVIGLTTAYFLARDGVRVRIVERGDFGREASWAGAGILPPGQPVPDLHPYDLLRAHSAALFPILTAELRERTGIDNGYLRCGGLELGAPDPSLEAPWRREGIAFEAVADAALQRLEPALAESLWQAYYLPGMAQVRNPRHLKALQAGCARLGVALQPGCGVQGFERQGSRVVAVRTDRGSLSAGRYLLAAGAWSEGLLQALGWQPGIRPVRGQIALLNTGAPLLRRIVMEGKCYLVPRPDGRILVGATEEDAGFDKRTTVAGIEGLLALARRLVPALADAQLERCWAGFRPGSPDCMPFLGSVPGTDNLYVAAGHFRAGLQLSPATGLLLKELLLGQTLTMPLEAFRLDRGPTAPPGLAFRS